MIFMNHVMAVHWIPSGEVPEAEENLHGLIVVQLHHVFACALHGQRRRRAVARQDPVLLKMDVDGMHPAARVVHQSPDFS